MDHVAGTGTLVVVSHGNDLEYLNIILNIFEDRKFMFKDIKFLDLSLILDDQDTFYRPLLRMVGITSPDQTVFNKLESIGYEVLRVKSSEEFESVGEMPAHVALGIEESIESALISRSGNEYLETSKWLKEKANKYRTEAVIAFNAVREHLTQFPEVSEVAVINGRFPCQRGVIEAAKIFNVPWSSYERGSYEVALPPFLYSAERYFRAVNYWYAKFPTYARIEKQKAILDMKLSNDQIHSNAVKNWFLSRRQAGGTNRFAETWKDTSDEKSANRFAVLFTSSVDEFAELGTDWKEAEWKDQWEAFEYLIPLLLNESYRPVLRIHPNLDNKPTKTRNATRIAIDSLVKKFPELEIIEPSAPTNSYSLLEVADLAIVWNSTIGLEASQMGVRTICLSSAEYDLVSDVKRWFKKEKVDFESLQNWSVDVTGSMKFIAGLFALDHKARPLLPQYGVNPIKFGRGIALFSNKWAMRNNNNLANIISIFLPTRVFIRLRRIVRRIRLGNSPRA